MATNKSREIASFLAGKVRLSDLSLRLVVNIFSGGDFHVTKSLEDMDAAVGAKLLRFSKESEISLLCRTGCFLVPVI